jgi:NTP pyrophosphatase (non-canonical NTP hydrolase)
MDIPALQARLRQFSAARHWEPYQTPKNLAMAMVVEVGELVEIFQWMTAEQSTAARDDAALRERIGEELSDVLVYLVQIADRCGVDLDDPVPRKIAKNAIKHPPA